MKNKFDFKKLLKNKFFYLITSLVILLIATITIIIVALSITKAKSINILNQEYEDGIIYYQIDEEEQYYQIQLKVEVLPEKTKNKKVSYTSSNEEILKVDENGLIKILLEQPAFITINSLSNSKVSKIVSFIPSPRSELTTNFINFEFDHLSEAYFDTLNLNDAIYDELSDKLVIFNNRSFVFNNNQTPIVLTPNNNSLEYINGVLFTKNVGETTIKVYKSNLSNEFKTLKIKVIDFFETFNLIDNYVNYLDNVKNSNSDFYQVGVKDNLKLFFNSLNEANELVSTFDFILDLKEYDETSKTFNKVDRSNNKNYFFGDVNSSTNTIFNLRPECLGNIYELKITLKYQPNFSETIVFEVNDGYNVYNIEDLETILEETSISKINFHNNLIINDINQDEENIFNLNNFSESELTFNGNYQSFIFSNDIEQLEQEIILFNLTNLNTNLTINKLNAFGSLDNKYNFFKISNSKETNLTNLFLENGYQSIIFDNSQLNQEAFINVTNIEINDFRKSAITIINSVVEIKNSLLHSTLNQGFIFNTLDVIADFSTQQNRTDIDNNDPRIILDQYTYENASNIFNSNLPTNISNLDVIINYQDLEEINLILFNSNMYFDNQTYVSEYNLIHPFLFLFIDFDLEGPTYNLSNCYIYEEIVEEEQNIYYYYYDLIEKIHITQIGDVKIFYYLYKIVDENN